MTRILALALFAVLAAGCATTSSVKEEMAPLSGRVTTLEQQDAALQAKLADLSRKSDAQSADVQALRKEIANYNAAAQKSAADADAAAVRAETAAAKAAKAFELRQMKGAK
jgi:chromosome segregation ATPase